MNVFGKLAVMALVCSICAGASAGVISYGDYNGTTVQFLGVQESGVNVSPGVTNPLYGTPVSAGNTLACNPVSFAAASTGLRSVTTDGTFTVLTIEANDGFGIDSLLITENGDFTFAGIGTTATNVGAAVSGVITILEINGEPVDLGNPALYSIPFGKILLDADLVNNSTQTFWSGEFFKSFDNITGDEEVITKLSINIDNTLTASSEVGTYAYVAKKQFQLRINTSDTVEVPEPSTLVLLVLGAVSLLFFRRK